MKKLLLLAIPLSLLTCKPHAADKLAQTKLDSLGGAMGLSYRSLLLVDTLRMAKALEIHRQYKTFIKQTLHDTLAKAEADALLQFMRHGEMLENFNYNRIQLLARASLVAQQTNKLTADLQNGITHAEEMRTAIEIETAEIIKLIEVIAVELKQGQTAIIEMRHALPKVELLIKKRNNNQLPSVTTDTLAF